MSRDLNAGAVRRLLDGLDLAPGRIEFVAKASTSEVWRAETGDGPVALRILAPRPGKPDDIDADIALRRLLLAGPAPVARPIADHRGRPDLAAAAHRPAWAVDTWVEGEPADAAANSAIWRDLGRLLAALHAVPVTGHGRLCATDDVVTGRRNVREAAVADRFEAPWPFDGHPLEDHPLAAADPGAIGRLQRIEAAIRAAADGPPVAAHTDLNGANIRHAGGRLSGVIDFADATALAAAWDFASLRYFHGPDAVLRTLGGYTTDRQRASWLAVAAGVLALVIALHHVSRARTLDLPARRTVALERLRRDLDVVERS